MAAPANHTLCASCGAPHDQWPALDEAGGGELCDTCFADAADDDWFTTAGHPHGLDNPQCRGELR